MLERKNLHKYQEKAIKFIKDKKRCALFLGMGLGKSVSSLTAIKDLSEDFTICRTLVIAPLRVANSVWRQEVEKWAHLKGLNVIICTGSTKERNQALTSDADIYVINRENIKWLVDNYQKNWKWDCIVIDEASSFKSHSSQRFKALKSILHLTDYMVLLTGTPASNGYMDLWSQMYLIDKGQALGKNITAYRSRFFSQFGYNYTLNKGADDVIKERIAPFTLTMTAEDYLELPDCLYLYNKIEMGKKLYSQYKSFADNLIFELGNSEITAMNAAVLTNKLMQFTNGAVYDEDKNVHHIHDFKIDALYELIEEEPDEPLLVAYNFKSDLERLTKAFPKAVVLDKDPKTIDKWNQGKIKMLLAHPASAGHGLNLQKGGSKIVWFGLNHSLELYEQFNARLNRQGQTKPVRIIHLILDGSIDQKVVASLDKKANVQNDLMEYFKDILKKV
jgi:SNF2 family DNA or RNA helicase